LHELGANSGDYVILGDDIAISESRLANKYVDFVTSQLGCKISEPKTLVSNKVAEFAGKVITADMALHPYKWKEVSDRNFVDLTRNLGQGFINLLRPRQRDVISRIAEVPEEYGGLGFNPKGLSYAERSNPKHPLVKFTDDRDLLGQRFLPATNVVKREFEFGLKLHLTKSQSAFSGTLFDPAVYAPHKQRNPQGVELPSQEVPTRSPNPENRPDSRNERNHPPSKPMDVIHNTLDMKRVKLPEDSTNPDYKVDSVESDPRGSSQLDRLEKLLKGDLSDHLDSEFEQSIEDLEKSLEKSKATEELSEPAPIKKQDTDLGMSR
jgi:hypothetical protein